MDAHQFDGWTRSLAASRGRRGALRLIVGGALAGLATLSRRSAAVACRDRDRPCRRDDHCCGGGRCRRGKCRCRPGGAPCTGFAACCSQSCDFLVDGGSCSPCRGRGCAASRDCCGGLSCQNSYCGGCRDRGVVCSGPGDCCFSDCSTIDGTTVCLSDAGGRCKGDVDCARCYLDGNCAGACVDGRCAEPGAGP